MPESRHREHLDDDVNDDAGSMPRDEQHNLFSPSAFYFGRFGTFFFDIGHTELEKVELHD
jgi:hypothetical protein